MATNKNATIRYRALDKCFRDHRHRYYIEDLIEKCEEELESFNFTANVSRRQIFDDIRFMESQAGWSIPLDVRPNNELVTQILSFGPDVEVLEPQSFREQIITKIKEYNKKYSLL